MKRFAVAFVAVLAMTQGARAGVEVGGTAGIHLFSEENTLGSPDGTVTHANSSLFALRLGFYFTSMFGVEIEGGLIPTESRGGVVTFDIWDITARAAFVAQFRADDPSHTLLPFVSAGGGIMRVIRIGAMDPSQFNLEMGYLGFVGAGAKYRTAGGWGVRADARFMVATPSDGFASDFEILLSLYREFGRKSAPKSEPPPSEEKDLDGDGIVGAADKCPKEAEDKDEFEDEDGCPDTDNDKDLIADATDKCPKDPEDKDSYEDDDGCPEPDNDKDGVADASDKCGDQPETRNGFEDEDGCPDELPQKLAKYTGTIQGINFKVNSADLLPASNKTLDKAVAVLNEFKDVKVEIQGHTDDQTLKAGGKFADNDALSQARAETVKAYFVKKGLTEDRLVAKGYGATVPIKDPAGLKGGKLNAARAVNRRVEFKLITPGAEEPKAEEKKPEPAPGGEPKAEEPKAEPKAEEPKAEDPKAAPKKGAKPAPKAEPAKP